MSSIQHWVGPRLPHWMARASGIALIVVGLSWPALTWPVPILATTGIAAGLPASLAAADALAQTPPMGWNGFNRFLRDVSEARVEAQARALVASGMQAAGYEYVNLDGGWDLLQRGPQGELQPDPAKFPHGIKPVADYVHSLGLKFGIYTSAGVTNCATHSAGSYGHYKQDAATFAPWGVDYEKLDWCRVPYRNYPGRSRQEVSRSLGTEMAAPLIAGTDLAAMSDVTRDILTNKAVIAVDQDPLGLQGRPIANAGGYWVVVKPLVSGAVAVVLFNSTDRPAAISTTAREVGMARTYAYRMVDLWSNEQSDTA